MDIIESIIDTSSNEFKENYNHYEKLVNDLKKQIIKSSKGGGEEKIKIHKIKTAFS